jgi:hypothetical protein
VEGVGQFRGKAGRSTRRRRDLEERQDEFHGGREICTIWRKGENNSEELEKAEGFGGEVGRISRGRRRDLKERLEEFRGSEEGGGIWRKGGKDFRDLEDSKKAGRLGGFETGWTRCGE